MKHINSKLLRALFSRQLAVDRDSVSDGDLLDRFTKGEAAAFDHLVSRHAQAVFGTCTRICRDSHDAEDAFQATFFVLARKAASVRRASLAGYLHRVAHRAATRAAVRRAKLQLREQSIAVDAPALTSTDNSSDLRAILDAEIDRLPDRYRLPMLLCYLHGLTTDAAAKRLGIPRGTILSRLATARQKLATRLTRRGVTVPATATGLFGIGAGQTVSASLQATAARNVMSPIPLTTASLLAQEILQMTALKTTTTWALAFVAIAGVSGGGAWALTAGGDGQPETARASEKATPEHPQKTTNKPDKPEPGDKKETGKPDSPAKKREVPSPAELLAEKRHLLTTLYTNRMELALESKKLREQRVAILKAEKYPDCDPKVLEEAIAKLDATRLETEMRIEESAPALDINGKIEQTGQQMNAVRERSLALIKSRRTELVRRLMEQKKEKLNQQSELEKIEQDLKRLEDRSSNSLGAMIELERETQAISDAIRGFPAPAPTSTAADQTLQRLVNEVAELKKEVRKLSEAKK